VNSFISVTAFAEFFGDFVAEACLRPEVVLAIFVVSHASVKDLTHGHGVVALAFKVFGEHGVLSHDFVVTFLHGGGGLIPTTGGGV